MNDIRVDADWLLGYSRQVADAAVELGHARDALNAAPLRGDAFGELGRDARTAPAYLHAAQTLHQQLARAGEVLAAAATGLHQVADHHRTSDEDSARHITRADRR